MSRTFAVRLAALFVVVAAAAPPAPAPHAPARGERGSPRSTLGDGRPNPLFSEDAQARFEKMSLQMGLALASVTGMPAETLGHSGFEFSFEWTAAQVQADEVLGDRYVWPVSDNKPNEWLHMPAFHVRKGFPFSFEVGSRVQYLTLTEMAALTVEAKWALNEGFLFIPDFSVRGHGTRLVGNRDYDLTTAGVDLALSKEIGLAGMLTLTPYVGWDILFINADSNIIDFDPVFEDPANPSLDDAVFESYTDQKNRFYGGVRYIGAVGTLGAEYSFAAAGDNSVQAFTGRAGLNF